MLGHSCTVNPNLACTSESQRSFSIAMLRPHPKPVATESLCDPGCPVCSSPCVIPVCSLGGERPRFSKLSPWCAYFLSQEEQQNDDQEFKSPPLTLTMLSLCNLAVGTSQPHNAERK